jgi:ribonuclease HII
VWEVSDLFAGDRDPWRHGLRAGVDEVGIGPLAGPVMAAAVLLNPLDPIEGLDDSKVLTHKRRETLAAAIKIHALSWAVGSAEIEEIDSLNILQASHLAMKRAIDQLRPRPKMAYVDGNKKPNLGMPVVAIVQGDKKIAQISAASIIAKVARDKLMIEFDQTYPGYGFARHKGYPTKAHFAALQTLGACPIHRRSFAPVKAVLKQNTTGAQTQGRMESTA